MLASRSVDFKRIKYCSELAAARMRGLQGGKMLQDFPLPFRRGVADVDFKSYIAM
jgi:hypothetical protein